MCYSAYTLLGFYLFLCNYTISRIGFTSLFLIHLDSIIVLRDNLLVIVVALQWLYSYAAVHYIKIFFLLKMFRLELDSLVVQTSIFTFNALKHLYQLSLKAV